MGNKRKLIACGLSIALILSMFPTSGVSAAKKPSLSTKKLTVNKGKSKVAVTITGKKKGTAKVQAKVGKKKYVCTVKVTQAGKNTTTATETPDTANISTEIPEQGEVLTLYYNDENAEEVVEQIKSSETSVHIIVESSVTSMGYYAFASCSALTSISIPDSVTHIERWAFWGCSSLNRITWNGNTYASADEFLLAFENNEE